MPTKSIPIFLPEHWFRVVERPDRLMPQVSLKEQFYKDNKFKICEKILPEKRYLFGLIVIGGVKKYKQKRTRKELEDIAQKYLAKADIILTKLYE